MTFWKNATAFITGGGSGIGRALAKALAQRDVYVVVTDVNNEAAAKVASECGTSATWHSLDVRNAAAVRECIETVVRERGRLDYLFNNAGIGIASEIHEVPLKAWDLAIDINVRGVIHGIVAAYPIMVKQGSGHIVNTASLAGLVPLPLLTPYAMTKHAIVGISTSLRIEGAPLGVKVSVLCPAAIDTPLLDAVVPPDLPPVAWIPNVRRFLTALAGPPYLAEKCAEDTLKAVERNQGIIVLPGRARLVWRLWRLFPWLVEKVANDAVNSERADRK